MTGIIEEIMNVLAEWKNMNIGDLLREAKRLGVNLLAEIDSILSSNNVWYSLAYGSVLGAYRDKGFIEWDSDIDIIIKQPDKTIVRSLLEKELSSAYHVVSCVTETTSSYDQIIINGIDPKLMSLDIYPVIGGPSDKVKGYQYQLYCRFVHNVFKCKYINLNRLVKKWKLPFVVLIKITVALIPDDLLRSYITYLSTKYPFATSEYFFPFPNSGKREEYMEADLLFQTKREMFENLCLPIPLNTEEYLERLYGADFMTPKQY